MPVTTPFLLDAHLPLEELAAIAHGHRALELAPGARARLHASADTLKQHLAQGALVYGLNTGFGPLADRAIDPALSALLQRGLIAHLSAGVGSLFKRAEVRAIITARIANLTRGWSGVTVESVEALLRLLEADCIPAVPQCGTVGASGDLTPLAHIVLAASGQGEMLGADDRTTQPAAAALTQAGLKPISLSGRTGLALVNGTAAMTALAALNAVAMERAIERLFALTLGYGELLGAHARAWHPRLAVARAHRGQRCACERLWMMSRDSRQLHQDIPQSIAPTAGADVVEQPLPQDPYSLRCAPQELGAALDLLYFHNQIVDIELNSACDNPLVDVEQAAIHHGGNFYGQQIAYAADTLALAVIKLGVFAERAIARLTDARLNRGLPPFLSGGRPGLDSGFMGAQVTATALVAEMRTLAVPASIQSIPTNANNQDVVTLGTIGARRCRDLLELLWQILAIEALVIAQGVDLRLRAGQSLAHFAASTQQLYQDVREVADFLAEDRPLAPEIAALASRWRQF
jgi:tyrosine ammonia-lyase